MTYFDVRIPGLKMTVVQADGQNVHPVTVDEFRIAVAETFDVMSSRQGRTCSRSSRSRWIVPDTRVALWRCARG